MEQTITSIGNSTGVVIPSSIVRKLGLKKGEKVIVEVTPDNRLVITKAENFKKSTSLTPEFLSWLKGFNKQYSKALKELSQK